MVREVGVEPTVFLMWVIYSHLSSPLDILSHLVGIDRIELPLSGSEPEALTIILNPSLVCKMGLEPIKCCVWDNHVCHSITRTNQGAN